MVLRLAFSMGGAAVAGGAAGTILSIAFSSIVSALTFFYTLLTVSLFVPLVVGLYVRRVRTTEALASTVAGTVVAGFLQLTTGGNGLAGMTPAMLGLGAALTAAIAAGAITRNRPVEMS